MKSNFFFSFFQKFSKPTFAQITYYTFIVYFITAFLGYLNFFLANLLKKNYLPLRSYLVLFNDDQITNISKFSNNVCNLAGFKTVINTTFPYKLADDLFFTLVSTILIILFYLGYKAVQLRKINEMEIVKWSIAFSLLMTLSIPSHSSDLYGYIARGAQQTLYHHNPYLHTVSEVNGFKSDPMFCNFMWPDQPTSYGPVFVYFTKAIVYLSHNNFLLSFINFKLLNLTLFLFLVLLALKVSNNSQDVYLIAWNPLILVQGLWNCHNDLFSGLLIFSGIYLFKKNNYFWSMFCLILALGIKYISILILPFLFLYVLKSNLTKNAFLNCMLGMFSGIILIIIFSMDYLLPQFQIYDLSKIIQNVGLVHKSLIATIVTIAKYFCRWQNIPYNLYAFQIMLKCCFYFSFAIFYLLVLLKRKSNLINDIALVLFVFFGFTIAKFHSWYLLNLMVLLPFVEKGLLKNLLIAMSMSHTYAITFLDQAKILNFISMTLLPTLLLLFKRNKLP